MRTPADLRAAYAQLAAAAPGIDQLHFEEAHRDSRRRVPIATAAILVAAVVAVLLVVVVRGGVNHHTQPAGPVLTCTSAANDRTAATKDAPVIRGRLANLGVHASVRANAGGTGVTITPRGADQLNATALCSNASFSARPVINASHPCTLTFSRPPAPGSVACGPGDTFLSLGPDIFSDRDIVSAVAMEPNPSAGSTEWSVAISLTAGGQAAWSAYTTAHNVHGADSSGADVATCGRPRKTPCADFVAFVVNGRVISVPLTLAPISGGTTQLTGGGTNGLTQLSAGQLAATLTRLPVPLISMNEPAHH